MDFLYFKKGGYMNKYIFFDLIKKNYKEFENGRMSNEFF